MLTFSPLETPCTSLWASLHYQFQVLSVFTHVICHLCLINYDLLKINDVSTSNHQYLIIMLKGHPKTAKPFPCCKQIRRFIIMLNTLTMQLTSVYIRASVFCSEVLLQLNIISRVLVGLLSELRRATGICAVAQLVECRTRNRESPGSNPRCYRFEVWAFSFTSRRLSRLRCINEYLAIDSGGNVSE